MTAHLGLRQLVSGVSGPCRYHLRLSLISSITGALASIRVHLRVAEQANGPPWPVLHGDP